MTIVDRRAPAAHPITDLLVERWSPRSFDTTISVTDAQLDSLLEAARWAPSAGNTQPRRFVVAHRGTPEFDRIVATLASGNVAWADRASVLLVAAVVTVNAEGKPFRWAEYDLGQAIAHLTVQAHAEGLHVHQMGGFDPDALSAAFALDDSIVPVSVTAIGVLGEASALPEPYLTRESADRTRLPLDELVLVRA